MNTRGIQLIGLVTHPWTPLVGVVPLLCLGYLLLVQPSAGQLSGIKISQESPELILGANKLAPIFAFASAEQVLPWLGEQAQKANVALRQVKQLPDQQGLAIRLHGDFPRATTLIQQLVRGTNLLIQPPLILQSHSGPSLQVDLQIRVQALPCLQQCSSEPLGFDVAEPVADAFAETQESAVGDASGLFFADTPGASLQWVGRLRWSTHTYELVRAPQGEVLMASKHARFGVERIDAEQLPGWVDDAS